MSVRQTRTSVISQPRVLLLAAGCLLLGVWLGHLRPRLPAAHLQTGSSLKVYFSPHGGATHALVRLIDSARKSVEVQAYSFTSRPIIKALIAARDRGVAVTVILDRSHLEKKNYRTGRYMRKPSPALEAFYTAGIPTYIDDRYLIAHNKVMLIDGATIVTGSFNFSYAAAKYNAENMLVIRNLPVLFKRYQANFGYHRQTSLRYHPGLVLVHQFHWPRH